MISSQYTAVSHSQCCSVEPTKRDLRGAGASCNQLYWWSQTRLLSSPTQRRFL